ncbi:MAG: twin-arginine translocase subunit TatC [Holophagales bacterium]|nr:twin-arginine translocase subunit TatC [Holophagales bacterium]MXX62489.1 twin-arginine translocase subunit TatC [Holophagales bacterium]MYC11712.1 twin-arginine translocase subunit TatC [Holophagales bacterium]MYD23955.1 twin-arginine translocase subunit TatC [Holophagales bacterium]MYI33492.1 twin-arginine translocase subunit TatC [Holophagales bacterium]
MTPQSEDDAPVKPPEAAEPERLPETRLGKRRSDEEEEELPRMTLLEHLDELRRRILRTLIVVVVAFFGCFAFAEEIYNLLARPIEPHVDQLVFDGVADPFIVQVKVALLASIFVTSPYLVAQLWGFVAPGLYRREKRYAIPFIFFGSLFFIGGGAFGYLVALPFATEFLVNMGLNANWDADIRIERYFSFAVNVLLGLAVMFQLPVVIFMLSQLGVVTPRFLMRHFRWAVLIIIVVSAVITPTPDAVNMTIVAGPTVLLYLVGVGASALVQRRRKRLEEEGD